MCDLRALSVLEPWAWCLFNGKPVENRSWPLPRWIVGKTVAIHASARLDREEYETAEDLILDAGLGIVLPPPPDLAFGAIIGTLRFTEDVTASDSSWFFGPHGWLTADAHLLPEVIPCRGALGFWRVPADAAARLKEAA